MSGTSVSLYGVLVLWVSLCFNLDVDVVSMPLHRATEQSGHEQPLQVGCVVYQIPLCLYRFPIYPYSDLPGNPGRFSSGL